MVLVGRSSFGLGLGRLAEWIGIGAMNIAFCLERGELLIGTFNDNGCIADFGNL